MKERVYVRGREDERRERGRKGYKEEEQKGEKEDYER